MLGANNDNWNLRNLIQEIMDYRKQLFSKLTHIFREGNGTFNFLAN